MARYILGAPRGMPVDHINRDSLDNRRCNLRLCTPAENVRNSKIPTTNTSGYKGVTWYRRGRKWHAHIQINGKTIHLGYYNDKLAARDAYDAAATKYFGAFARPNSACLA
jgi:hypothetical protein